MEQIHTEEMITMANAETGDPGAPERRRKSPALAGILSSMPGLGQVYLGYYRRGFVHLMIVAFLITILSSGALEGIEPLFGLSLSFFWIFNIIDAVRLANLYNDVMSGLGPEDLRKELSLKTDRGSIGGGVALIALGILLFAHTLFDVSLDWLADWWPALPLGFGVYLLYKGVVDRRKRMEE